jgi:hypothetical protein
MMMMVVVMTTTVYRMTKDVKGSSCVLINRTPGTEIFALLGCYAVADVAGQPVGTIFKGLLPGLLDP